MRQGLPIPRDLVRPVTTVYLELIPQHQRWDPRPTFVLLVPIVLNKHLIRFPVLLEHLTIRQGAIQRVSAQIVLEVPIVIQQVGSLISINP